MPEVRLENVTKKYGKIIAVKNVNLHVHDKEYFSLIGPSGCGKTTLLRLIAGLVQPDEGKIFIENKLVTHIPPEDRGIGFVFQTYALFPHMNAWDNVTYGPRVKAWEEEKRERIGREMLEMVKLYERADAIPKELSGGMMQRVALARALAADAKLLLLDEPLGALDAKIRFRLRYELRKLVKDLGLTAVHVTHDQGEAMAISDRIAVMKKGKILQVGTPQELYMKPQHVFVVNFIGESNFLEGYIVEINGKGCAIELRGGVIVNVVNQTRNKGERVVLAVRPETLSIEKGHKKGLNCITGHIERFRFEGTDVRYEVRLKNDDVVVVVRPALMGEWFNEGEKVTACFPTDKSYLFTYPSLGLRSELALE
ncbi:ABC transporter ATP-binding protein [Candidatus Bathyarchaeota archaeon]|nr:ABC transporter ATP-binding protein [Candidatus Bathyarchaeota archaeon]